MSSVMPPYEKSRYRPGGDEGFTLTEVLVVAGISVVVLSVLLTTLEVAVRQERRTTAIVDNQFYTMNAFQAMTREIRGANPLEVAGVASSEEMRRAITVSTGSASGGDRATWRFRVDGTGRLVQERFQGTTVVLVRPLLHRVGNSPTQPIFRYFDEDRQELTTTGSGAVAPSVIANCTVRVVIHVVSISEFRGAPPYEATTDAQVRNKLPGGTGC